MLDTILGLPAHPLFVHAAVVLLPLMALLTAALAWHPTWWSRWAVPAAVLDGAVLVATWVAKESGERLEHRLARSQEIHQHAELGEKLPLIAAALLACAVLMAVLGRRAQGGPARPVALAGAVVTTLVALAIGYLTARVGHSGAVAVWHDVTFVR